MVDTMFLVKPIASLKACTRSKLREVSVSYSVRADNYTDELSKIIENFH